MCCICIFLRVLWRRCAKRFRFYCYDLSDTAAVAVACLLMAQAMLLCVCAHYAGVAPRVCVCADAGELEHANCRAAAGSWAEVNSRPGFGGVFNDDDGSRVFFMFSIWTHTHTSTNTIGAKWLWVCFCVLIVSFACSGWVTGGTSR